MLKRKQTEMHVRNVPRFMGIILAGSSFVSLSHLAAEGRALVRCLVVDEDPEGTEHVSHMIQASHKQLQTD